MKYDELQHLPGNAKTPFLATQSLEVQEQGNQKSGTFVPGTGGTLAPPRVDNRRTLRLSTLIPYRRENPVKY